MSASTPPFALPALSCATPRHPGIARVRQARLALVPGALLLWLLVLAPFAALAQCREGDPLVLLHFNDFHGQLAPLDDAGDGEPAGGIARLASAVAQVRDEVPGRPVVLLFGGDLLLGTLTSGVFHGLPDVGFFNRMGVDAAVLGNHEFDFGQAAFRDLAAAAHFPFLSANVRAQPRALPLRSSVILTPAGMRVAVLGLTTPDVKSANSPDNVHGVRVANPLEVAREQVPQLRAQADLVIVLSHLGEDLDRKLASGVPGIDVIVGGHNHFVLHQPRWQGKVAILQAGARGRWLGRMDLVCHDGHLVTQGYQLLPMDDAVAPDPEIATEVEALTTRAEAGLNVQIGEAPDALGAQRSEVRRHESAFADLLADLAREATHAEIVLLNGGSIRSGIPAGPVTLKQVYEALPYRNEWVIGRLSGERILAALAQSAALDPDDNPGGFLQVSGLRYRIAGARLDGAWLNGQPLDPQRQYRVAMPDFLASGGDGYAMLTGLQGQVQTGYTITDLLIGRFRAGTPVTASVDGRIVRLPEETGDPSVSRRMPSR